ncbi:MAG: type II toxin-antitoxin system RelB/DinJ family antitoxin [Lachnospiraceae bacterium]|nr:type II toxin-antitoxin system RelB/DinJ family antitoxin [Lachnospiraceae bacterium]
MAKTANLYARIEPDVKEEAENILSTLGLTASNAINMFYKQIILQKGIPFEVKIPDYKVIDASLLSEEEMNAELEKGYEDLKKGKTKSIKETFDEIRKDCDL